MSQTSNPAPTRQDAERYLLGEVYVPVFLEKLANDFGIVPQSDAEVESLLAIASDLSAQAAEAHTKAARDQQSLISAAADALRGGQPGYRPQAKEEALIKGACDKLSRDPHFQAAAVLYHQG
jgi:hypothetical protein